MPAALSPDLRLRVVTATQTQTLASVALRFAVSRATVQRFVALERAGSLAPKPHGGGHARRLTPEHEALIEAWIAHDPSTTQTDIAARLAEHGCTISRASVGRALRRMGYTRKKRP